MCIWCVCICVCECVLVYMYVHVHMCVCGACGVCVRAYNMRTNNNNIHDNMKPTRVGTVVNDPGLSS